MKDSPAGKSTEKRVVLTADSATLEGLRKNRNLKLRIFCDNGSSVLISLRNREDDAVKREYSGLQTVTLKLSIEEFLDCLGQGLEVIFWNKDTEKGAVFFSGTVASDSWFGGLKPMCESIHSC